MNAKEYAAALAAAFTTSKRHVTREEYTHLVDGAPEWARDIVRTAHGDMMPDDQRYHMIREVVSALAERDEDEWEDAQHEICDGLVDVYTGQLTAWLATHLDRVGYVTQAAADYGSCDDAAQSIARGQFAEYAEIFASVTEGLRNLASEEEEA